MDKIGIVQKHLSRFKELKPGGRKPREPKEPQKPQEAIISEKRQANYDKRLKVYQKRIEEYKNSLQNWQRDQVRKESMKQIKVTKERTLIAGSAHRMMRLGDVSNELEDDYFLGGDGSRFPEFERILDQEDGTYETVVIEDPEGLKKMLDVLVKATRRMKIEIRENQIHFYPVEKSKIESDFISSSYTLDSSAESEIEFAICTKYLADLFQLLKQLKIRTVAMQVSSPIRPIRFTAQNFEYLIAPIRIHWEEEN